MRLKDVQAAHVKEAEMAFKESFRFHDPQKSGTAIYKMYAHMKQVKRVASSTANLPQFTALLPTPNILIGGWRVEEGRGEGGMHD